MGSDQKKLLRQIAQVGQAHGAEKMVLFGSRARGDHQKQSDVDIAVYGMPPQNQAGFRLDMEELPTLLKFDIVYVTPDIQTAFRNSIEQEGVTIYEKD